MAKQKVQLTATGKPLPLFHPVAFNGQESLHLSRLLLTALSGKNSAFISSAKIFHKIAKNLKISTNSMVGGVCGMVGGVCFWVRGVCFLVSGFNFLVSYIGLEGCGNDFMVRSNSLVVEGIGFGVGGFNLRMSGLRKTEGGNGSPKNWHF